LFIAIQGNLSHQRQLPTRQVQQSTLGRQRYPPALAKTLNPERPGAFVLQAIGQRALIQ